MSGIQKNLKISEKDKNWKRNGKNKLKNQQVALVKNDKVPKFSSNV